MPKPCVGCAQPKTNSPPNPAPRKKTSGPKKPRSPAQTATTAYKFPEPDLRQKRPTLQEQLELLELEQQYQQKVKEAAKRRAERHGEKQPGSFFEMQKLFNQHYANKDAKAAVAKPVATGGKRRKARPAKR